METTLVVQGMNALGEGAYIPVVLAVIGAASAISTVYPANWPGAVWVHKFALLVRNAAPAVPAGKE